LAWAADWNADDPCRFPPSIHVVMLQVLGIPYPEFARVSAWASFLNTAFSILAVIVFCSLAQPRLGRFSTMTQCVSCRRAGRGAPRFQASSQPFGPSINAALCLGAGPSVRGQVTRTGSGPREPRRVGGPIVCRPVHRATGMSVLHPHPSAFAAGHDAPLIGERAATAAQRNGRQRGARRCERRVIGSRSSLANRIERREPTRRRPLDRRERVGQTDDPEPRLRFSPPVFCAPPSSPATEAPLVDERAATRGRIGVEGGDEQAGEEGASVRDPASRTGSNYGRLCSFLRALWWRCQ
jgi:hypothetical protein